MVKTGEVWTGGGDEDRCAVKRCILCTFFLRAHTSDQKFCLDWLKTRLPGLETFFVHDSAEVNFFFSYKVYFGFPGHPYGALHLSSFCSPPLSSDSFRESSGSG